MNRRILLRSVAVSYVAALLMLPFGVVFWNAVRGGLAPVLAALSSAPAMSALRLSLLVAVVVVPLNTVFGVWCGLQLVRGDLPRIVTVTLNRLVDMPLVVSDVIVGVALLTLYGSSGWLGRIGIPVVFAVPGIVLVTTFITLPFVVREVVPALRERGVQQEQAAATLGASTLQILWRITLPSLRRAITCGMTLTTARALGEYGAVSVVSGGLANRTQTLTQFVDARLQSFDTVGANAAALLLMLIAMGTVVVVRRLSLHPLETLERA